MSNNNLQRMIVIPPEIFEKWKHIISEDQKLSILDKKMRDILFNSKLNDINKWYQYRENLLKYSFSKKGSIKLSHTLKPITSEKSMQTNRIPKKDKAEQTIEDFQQKNPELSVQSTQTDEYVQPFEDNDEVFYETHNVNHSSKNEDGYYNVENNLDDDETRALALMDAEKDVRILKERHSTDPSSYKLFELSDGAVVNVPTLRTTRSMKSHAGSKKSPSKHLLKQPTLNFKKVKGPKTRAATASLRKLSESTLAENSGGFVNWTSYK